MTRRPSPLRILLLTAVAALAACDGGSSERPDRIVVATIDTLRADRVGAYGYERAHTPTLDGLAERGTLFETALSPVPLTLPSHATLFTGLEPPRHGVRHNAIYRLAESIPTLTERLAATDRATAAFLGAVVLHSRYGLARSFDVYDLESERLAAGLGGYAERTADAVADAALAWLEDAPPRFFLWIHFYDPHAEYEPPPGFRLSAPTPYDGEIAFSDSQLGRILARIDERFGPEGTLVVATSDHGEALGEHGEITHSYSIYEATQRVPLILAGPGVPAGRRIRAPVRLADVAPTVLALTGAEPLPDVDGRDLGPWLDAGEPPAGPPAYMETVATRYDYGWSPLYGLRDERWKYIQAPRPELYDLANDPGERENLVARETERVSALDRALTALRDQAPVAAAEAVQPDEAERAQLESLGYVVPDGPDAGSLEISGKDPKDGAETLVAIAEANRLRNTGRAREAYERLRAIDEGGTRLLHVRFHAALLAGLPVEAEAEAREALETDHAHADSYSLLGAALEVQDRTEEALAAYESSLALEGDRPYPALGRARTLEALGRLDDAAREYEAVRALDPGLDEPVWRLAALAIEHGEPERARAWLAELDEEDVGEPKAALRLALAEEKAGRPEQAIERLATARARSPEDESIANYEANLLGAAGRTEELAELATGFLDTAPEAVWAQNAAAWALALLGRDLDRALALAEQAERATGGNAAVLDTLATVHLARGEPELALARADAALAVDEAGALAGQLHFLRASSLSALSRDREARRALARSFETDSGDSAAEWHGRRAELANRLGVEPPRDDAS